MILTRPEKQTIIHLIAVFAIREGNKTSARVRLFGCAILISGIIFSFSAANGPETGKTFSLISSLLIVFAGIYIIFSKNQDKMKSIGLYALTFGLAKVLAAVTKIETQDDIMRYTAIVSMILGALFVLFGLSYLLGTSKKIFSKVLVSLFFIVIDGLRIENAYKNGVDVFTDGYCISYAVEIAVLFLFVTLLLSKDVRINTVNAKIDNSKKLAKDMKADCRTIIKKAKIEARAEKKKGNKAEAKRIMKNAKAKVKTIKKSRKKMMKRADKTRYYTDENGKIVTESEYRAKNRKRRAVSSILIGLYTFACTLRKSFYIYNINGFL